MSYETFNQKFVVVNPVFKMIDKEGKWSKYFTRAATFITRKEAAEHVEKSSKQSQFHSIKKICDLEDRYFEASKKALDVIEETEQRFEIKYIIKNTTGAYMNAKAEFSNKRSAKRFDTREDAAFFFSLSEFRDRMHKIEAVD